MAESAPANLPSVPPSPSAAGSTSPAAGASYLEGGSGPAAWLLSLDHKRIAVMYLVSVLVAFALGLGLAALMRLKMLWPGEALMSADEYHRLFTLHGVVMGFAFLVPAIPGVLGNFLLPLMIGARSVASPRLNRAALYVYWLGALLALVALARGGPDTGWTLYPPYSVSAGAGPVPAVALGVFVMGFSGVINGVNFLITIHTLRAPGLSWRKLPLMVWALYATSLLHVVAVPALGSAMLVLVADRALGLGYFDLAKGGDPLEFQRMFWFYAHPAVYLALLPAAGVISEVIAVHARRVFGYGALVVTLFASAALGLLAWGQHLVVSGQSAQASTVFSALALLAALPPAAMILHWLASLWRGSIALSVPMLYALGFVALAALGGLSGLFLAMLGPAVHLTATYFELAHLHYLVVGGALMAFLAGLYHWWPKITGRMYSQAMGRAAWALVMVGVNATFFVQFVLGSRGMPRRHYAYDEAFRLLQSFSTVGTWILGAGLLLALAVFVHSLREGRRAAANPWGGATLEWRTASPPVAGNFALAPVVTHGPYDFAAALAPEAPPVAAPARVAA